MISSSGENHSNLIRLYSPIASTFEIDVGAVVSIENILPDLIFVPPPPSSAVASNLNVPIFSPADFGITRYPFQFFPEPAELRDRHRASPLELQNRTVQK